MGEIDTRLHRLCINPNGSYCDILCANDFSERTELAYDIKTRIVYYKFRELYFMQPKGAIISSKQLHCSYMSPYISENGKYCRFFDNKIVEIG